MTRPASQRPLHRGVVPAGHASIWVEAQRLDRCSEFLRQSLSFRQHRTVIHDDRGDGPFVKDSQALQACPREIVSIPRKYPDHWLKRDTAARLVC